MFQAAVDGYCASQQLFNMMNEAIIAVYSKGSLAVNAQVVLIVSVHCLSCVYVA